MILPSEGIVDVARLSRIYDNTTATYKFYWFVSIINLISANPNKRVFSFEEIIAEMIAEAWYPIHYFSLSFGKLDSLESNIFEIQRILDVPIDANKDVVRETILKNKEIQSVKRCLSIFMLNVPYRFLSPQQVYKLEQKGIPDIVETSNEVFTTALFLVAGYPAKAAEYADLHGGVGPLGGTGNWMQDRRKDEDDLAFWRRCVSTAAQMMRPARRGRTR